MITRDGDDRSEWRSTHVIPVRAVLVDLLMATMDSLEVWATAAGDSAHGLAWRDAVTRRMTEAGRYVPYERLVAEAATEHRLSAAAISALGEAWLRMEPWPDSVALQHVPVAYAFVTNSSTELARIATQRSGTTPRFTLSAEEAGWYKPHPSMYREACRRLGSRRERTVFVAGSAYDAAGARDAGLQAILVRRRIDQEVPDGVPVAGSLDEAVRRILETDATFAPEARW